MRKSRKKNRDWDDHPKFHQWYFYHCDYPLYDSFRPMLRQAKYPEDFGSLALNLDSREALRDFEENELDMFQARQAMVEAQCCLGEPFVAGREFVRTLTFLKRREAGITASTLLEDMLFGRLNMQDWSGEPERLMGVLTPDERRALSSSVGFVRKTIRRSPDTFSPVRITQKILSGLLDIPPAPDVTTVQFHRFLMQATNEGTGLIAFWI